jgi:hypothetical protein
MTATDLGRIRVCPTTCRSAVNADGRVRSYHDGEEVRAEPTPAPHEAEPTRTAGAFIRRTGGLDGALGGEGGGQRRSIFEPI